jgi:hypothetical protein
MFNVMVFLRVTRIALSAYLTDLCCFKQFPFSSNFIRTAVLEPVADGI